MTTITGNAVQGMVEHWLRTPVNSYLGSDYGQGLNDLLQRPLGAIGSEEADEVLAKLRADVPALGALPAGAVNLFGVATPPDRTDFVIEVAGNIVGSTGGG